MNKKEKKAETTIATKYKIKMIVEITGEIETLAENDSVRGDLREGDAGIWRVVRWAQDDIEDRIEGTCEVLNILSCNMEQSFETMALKGGEEK